MSNWKTPVGPLKWTFVSDKGAPKYGKEYTSEDPADFEYKASMIVDGKTAKHIQNTVIKPFWDANKPAKIAKPTSTFLKPEMVETDDVDEYGAKLKKESGNYIISASTNANFKNKDGWVPNKIVLLRKNGQTLPENHPLVKGDVGVADGSTGVIHGVLAVTEYEGKAYVKFYLKGVQFAKFVPYESTGVTAEALEGDEDDGLGGDGLDDIDTAPITDSEGPQL